MFGYTGKTYSDTEAIIGLQQRNRTVERAFFDQCQRYFDTNRHALFVNPASGARELDDIFLDAWTTLWEEIDSHKIFVSEGTPCRINSQGEAFKMTSSLTTFLMSIARNKYHEDQRMLEHTAYGPIPEKVDIIDPQTDDDNAYEQIIRACVASLSSRCRDILNKYYYEGLSLEMINQQRGDGASYNGLKAAKAKCMDRLEQHVVIECKRRNIKL